MTYPTLCSVCNGMESVSASCPSCQGSALDQGKLSDYYGPYSPYRSMDDLKLTNGYADMEQQQCVHYGYCPQCDTAFPFAVQEQALGDGLS
ncbi:hypothetical protein [Paenibacillus sp. YYML68]|uniref:hypothetical protein n=1 Tax=Paenibacillus sp. YYML68 TaxID=2909250 RepID=UPI0024907FFC|nr:hypothetical protein [Paenibacillus sp. YYML68]